MENLKMILRYIWYLVSVRFLMGTLGNIFIFPISWIFRKRLKKGSFLWYWLHDTNTYGDKYFNPKQKETFWIAWKWVIRNPLENYKVLNKIKGEKYYYSGWATCHKDDNGKNWRTVKTTNKDGVYEHKYGKYLDIKRSILGKQRITFYINGVKYFRFSGAVPVKLWNDWYWIFEYKFGFENYSYAEQLHMFTHKKYKGEKIKYKKIVL